MFSANREKGKRLVSLSDRSLGSLVKSDLFEGSRGVSVGDPHELCEEGRESRSTTAGIGVPMNDQPLDDSLIALTMEAMRLRGATLFSGGSRCHTTEGWRDGGWYREGFDEGYVDVTPLTEEDIRRRLRAEPAKVRALLYADARRVAVEAMLRDDLDGVVAGIQEAGKFAEINANDRLILGVCRGELTQGEKDALRKEIAAHTLWHLFMNLTGWTRTPENGRRGLAFLERSLALIGPPEPFCAAHQRASFHGLIGDAEGELAALERGLEHPEATLAQRADLHLSIARLQVRSQSLESARSSLLEAIALAEQTELGKMERRHLLESSSVLALKVGEIEGARRCLHALELSARREGAPEIEWRNSWTYVVKTHLAMGDLAEARRTLEAFRQALASDAAAKKNDYTLTVIEDFERQLGGA
jgi:hypothetical protein